MNLIRIAFLAIFLCHLFKVNDLHSMPPLGAGDTFLDISICQGDSFFVQGAFQDTANTYFDTLTASMGGDSIVVTNLMLVNQFLISDTVELCAIDSYFVGGAYQTVTDLYYDTLIASGGCDSILETYLLVSPVMAAMVSTTDAVCQNMDGTATANVTGGIGPFSYMWSNNKTSVTIDSLSSGNYSVTVTDVIGCTATRMAEVQTDNLDLTAGVITNNSTCSFANGAATAVVSGGTLPYSFIWSNGQTGNAINNVAQGAYFLTVTDGIGCIVLDTGVVMVDTAEITVMSTSTNASSCQALDGSATASALDGVPPYFYVWSNDASDSTAFGLLHGLYTVTITDLYGCMGTDSIVVLANVQPVAADFLVDSVDFLTNLVCFEDLSMADSVKWDFGDGSVSTERNPCHDYQIAGNVVVTLTSYTICGASIDSARIQKVVYLRPLGISDLTKNISLNIISNPSEGVIQLVIQSAVKENIQVSCHTLLGKNVYYSEMDIYPGRNSKTLALEHLTHGIYVIAADTRESRYIQKVIVNNR